MKFKNKLTALLFVTVIALSAIAAALLSAPSVKANYCCTDYCGPTCSCEGVTCGGGNGCGGSCGGICDLSCPATSCVGVICGNPNGCGDNCGTERCDYGCPDTTDCSKTYCDEDNSCGTNCPPGSGCICRPTSFCSSTPCQRWNWYSSCTYEYTIDDACDSGCPPGGICSGGACISSCFGLCGGWNYASSCGCDSGCTELYGDCCDDYSSVCQCTADIIGSACTTAACYNGNMVSKCLGGALQPASCIVPATGTTSGYGASLCLGTSNPICDGNGNCVQCTADNIGAPCVTIGCYDGHWDTPCISGLWDTIYCAVDYPIPSHDNCYFTPSTPYCDGGAELGTQGKCSAQFC